MSKNKPEIKEVHQKKKIASPKGVFREYFESFATTLVMAIFGMTFILQAVTVPTGSMQNTILIGDYLLVNKFIFAPGGKPVPFLPQREIKQGDIIVFKYPGFPPNLLKKYNREDPAPPFNTSYVKRVIGMPGDKVEFRNNQVFINDVLLPEHRIIADPPKNSSKPREAALIPKEFESRTEEQKYDVYYSENSMKEVDSGEWEPRVDMEYGVAGRITKVPEDSYFVMGDSRDNSEDSRYWGFVHRDLIVGRAMFVYWSCDRASGSMLSCLTSPRFDRIGKMIK